MTKSEASTAFQISRNTIDLWLKRQASTGDLAPSSNTPVSRQRTLTEGWGMVVLEAIASGRPVIVSD
ncbi:hypothetical protein XM38_027720 [Halomicronema hongdechloris C2206]|uniref:Transposase Synechocystis PCC 6803 domain-containing protein n=1 Tax=Halomicronema hongdechloris C2206 TaxID=1641165 RepID=A0A1Z3HND3_9CYAN|nr:hypothetical protein XM38_027720 [Halomicronema hongdechloris C2206]